MPFINWSLSGASILGADVDGAKLTKSASPESWANCECYTLGQYIDGDGYLEWVVGAGAAAIMAAGLSASGFGDDASLRYNNFDYAACLQLAVNTLYKMESGAVVSIKTPSNIVPGDIIRVARETSGGVTYIRYYHNGVKEGETNLGAEVTTRLYPHIVLYSVASEFTAGIIQQLDKLSLVSEGAGDSDVAEEGEE